MSGRPTPHDAVRVLLDAHSRVVLAVSGGLDSMVLMHAVAAVRRDAHHVVVATFDHGTGPHATAAADLVEREATRLGLGVRRGRAALAGESEASWRAARWRFLRDVAAAEHATVATAHTRDDQVETVVFRVMRHSGPRGLAGLYADSGVARPFIHLTRAELESSVRRTSVPYLHDPSNALRDFARNRLRLDILPALRASRPEFDDEWLAIAARAADLRRQLERVVSRFVIDVNTTNRSLTVDRSGLANLTVEQLRVLWPALAARANVTLDRRGTTRLAAFTIDGEPGARMQLSGGAEVRRIGDRLVIGDLHVSNSALAQTISLDRDEVAFGPWRFHREPVAVQRFASRDCRTMALPADSRLEVRAWQPGDRMRVGGPIPARRVKRFLSDARVAGPERDGWPVVLADGEIVWIPGIRRSDAATVRSGRPLVQFTCERFDR